MAINWTNLIGNLAGFTVVAGFLWKGLRLAEHFVAERTATAIENQRKALAQAERITTLEAILDTVITRQNQQDKFLARWTQGEYHNSEHDEYYVGDDAPYHVREDVPNLQKKGLKRLKNISTDFTSPHEN